jgi:serine/threonine protein phosphatase PrpC
MIEPIWHVVGASVKGSSHEKREQPCQDAHAFCVTADGYILVAVGDGAGSADRSDQGSRLAVDTAIATLEKTLDAGPPADDADWMAAMIAAFCAARQAIAELSEIEEQPTRAYATTLTCAAIADECLVVGQIGDGVAVARRENGHLFAATEPQHGEYANETFFLTMAEAMEQLEVGVFTQKMSDVALMTDGLVRLAMKVAENRPHSPFFEPLFAFASQVEDEVKAQVQLEALLASERVCERTDDDKTLVLIARSSELENDAAQDTGTG